MDMSDIEPEMCLQVASAEIDQLANLAAYRRQNVVDQLGNLASDPMIVQESDDDLCNDLSDVSWNLENFDVAGEFALEVCSGEAIFTLGLMMAKVPCIKPWDVKHGENFDVLKNGHVLISLASSSHLVFVHMAPPCQSATWGRFPALRTWSCPAGVPNLSGSQLKLVNLGNAVASFCISLCLALYIAGGYFSLENPRLSWLWALDACLSLYSLDGVIFSLVLYSSFGAAYSKPTIFMHNTPTLHLLQDGEPGTVSVKLRGLVQWLGEWVARTSLASMYPPELGKAFGLRVNESLQRRKESLENNILLPMAYSGFDFGFPLPSPDDDWLNSVVGDSYRFAADVVEPFVQRGDGAAKGFSQREHVAWAMNIEHPWADSFDVCFGDTELAVQYECSHHPSEIDRFRENVCNHWIKRASELKEQQQQWSKGRRAIGKLVERIHGPLMLELIDAIDFDDDLLHRHCETGFPYIGPLPPCYESMSDQPLKMKEKISVEQVRADRKLLNEAVISRLRDDEFSDDVMKETKVDIDFGCMARLTPIDQIDLSRISVSRRIPVRELRAKGWRTRVVDHMTESMHNPATVPADKIRHDNVDALVRILVCFMRNGVCPEMWKRDISKAFRRLPVQISHLDMSWVVFLHAGIIWAVQHLGMPFGTTAAVYAWHRIGGFMSAVVQRLCNAPVARYVDDYFGASRSGVKYSGGKCLEIFAELLGFPTDPAKSDDHTLKLLILGAEVAVILAQQSVSVCVAHDKAVKWSRLLHESILKNNCDAGMASKQAGRLSFAVSVTTNKVGRAFIKPLYAQAACPLPGGKMTLWLVAACWWWISYLQLRPPSLFSAVKKRKHSIIWTDAAGASRWIAAVVFVDNRWLWTRMIVPQSVWDCFLARNDDQIGMQELLAIPLAFETFASEVKDTLSTLFVDNNGVLGGLIRGSCMAADLNQAIGSLWLDIARLQIGLHAVRVESKANIADGPTREFLGLLGELGASFVPPKLPAWTMKLWNFPSS